MSDNTRLRQGLCASNWNQPMFAESPANVDKPSSDRFSEEVRSLGSHPLAPTIEPEWGAPAAGEVDEGGKAFVDRNTKRRSHDGPVGQHAAPLDESWMPVDRPAPRNRLERVVTSMHFEILFSFLIFANAIVLAMEVQYMGIDNGYKMGHPSSPRPAAEAWPNALDVFQSFEYIFGVMFCVELALKVGGLQWNFVKSPWNWLDVLVVGFWLVDQIASGSVFLNPMILRLMRLSKIFRLARMLKTIQVLDSLNVMLGSIQASVTILFWSVVLLLLVQMGIALFLCGMLEEYILDDSNDARKRIEIYNYFGTFTRGMLTMFELSLANWIPVCRSLHENVDEWYGLFVLCYQLVVGFAVVKVITGVFLHETFKVTSSDDDLMIVQKKRASQKHVLKMQHLLREADDSKDGYIQREELRQVLLRPSVRNWLTAMEIEVGDPDLLFDFLDNGDEQLSCEELVSGIARLKGPARSIDVVSLMRRTAALHDGLKGIMDKVDGLEASFASRGSSKCVKPKKPRDDAKPD
mmetsp:Transcript_42899/g.121373  ORF Transcript_42899/g.121373 Transcript_42899/m.121373 type:complete len:521 (+) Transcript_42899:2-1564(+)